MFLCQKYHLCPDDLHLKHYIDGCVFNCQPSDTLRTSQTFLDVSFHFLCFYFAYVLVSVLLFLVFVFVFVFDTLRCQPLLAFHFHFLRSSRFPGLRNTQWAHCSIHAGTLCIHETSLNRNGLLTTLKICVNLLVRGTGYSFVATMAHNSAQKITDEVSNEQRWTRASAHVNCLHS